MNRIKFIASLKMSAVVENDVIIQTHEYGQWTIFSKIHKKNKGLGAPYQHELQIYKTDRTDSTVSAFKHLGYDTYIKTSSNGGTPKEIQNFIDDITEIKELVEFVNNVDNII